MRHYAADSTDTDVPDTRAIRYLKIEENQGERKMKYQISTIDGYHGSGSKMIDLSLTVIVAVVAAAAAAAIINVSIPACFYRLRIRVLLVPFVRHRPPLLILVVMKSIKLCAGGRTKKGDLQQRYLVCVLLVSAATHRSEKQLQRVITMAVEFVIMIMAVVAGTIIMLEVMNGSKQYWQFKQKYNKFNLFELINLRNFSELAVVLVRHPYPDRAFKKGRPVIGKRFNVRGSRQSSTTSRKALTEAFLFIRLWHSDF